MLALLGACSSSTPVAAGRDWEAVIDEILAIDITAVENDLRAQCMIENGFEFDAASSAVRPAVTYDPVAEFGSADEARRAIGTGLIYGLIDSLRNPPEQPPPYPSPEYEEAMWSTARMSGGVFRGGCVAWAQEQAQSDPHVRAAEELAVMNADPIHSAPDSPEVVAAWQAWSRCMAEEGFANLDDRSDLVALVGGWKAEVLAASADTDEIIARLEELLIPDRALAVADGKCSEESQADWLTQEQADRRVSELVSRHRDLIRDIATRLGLGTPD